MKYTGIADTGAAFLNILRDHLVPEVIKSREKIGLCSPAERGDLSVGVWLYDIREAEELRNHAMVTIDTVRQKYPSSYVMLYYMITAYSGGDFRYQAAEEHKILGKIIQAMKDHPILHEVTEQKEGGEQKLCTVEAFQLSMEDKLHIFNAPGSGYKASLFYAVGPVEIESEKTKETQRVVNLRFGFREV